MIIMWICVVLHVLILEIIFDSYYNTKYWHHNNVRILPKIVVTAEATTIMDEVEISIDGKQQDQQKDEGGNYNDNVNSSNNNNIQFYHLAKMDRTGSVIQDMLTANAYAYYMNYTYIGACPNIYRNIKQIEKFYTLHKPIHERMIHTILGLSHILQFRCPENITTTTTMNDNNNSNNNIIVAPYNVYTGKEQQLWTKEWIQYIKSQRRHIQQQSATTKRIERQQHNNIIVHIRRGDVSLCNSNYKRYLPNQYYINMIDKYNYNNESVVTIFSESISKPESLDVFYERKNYNIQLDTSITDIWDVMINNANVLILSKSSFSIVPALLTNADIIVYYPYYELQPLSHWHIVPNDIQEQVNQYEKQLQQKLC